jgi:hypothetical protein
VIGAETAYARKLGVKLKQPAINDIAAIDELREAIAAVVGALHAWMHRRAPDDGCAGLFRGERAGLADLQGLTSWRSAGGESVPLGSSWCGDDCSAG